MSEQETIINLDDETLVEYIKEGNEKALRILGKRYSIELFKIVKYQLKYYCKIVNRNDVVDLANITLQKMLIKIDTYDSNISKLKTWVSKIARNTVIDFLRKKNSSTKKNLNDKFWDKIINKPIKEEILKEIKSKFTKSELLDLVLDNLSYQEKNVIQLIWSGKDYKDITEFLGIEYNNAKTIYCRIIQKVRKIFNKLIEGFNQ